FNSSSAHSIDHIISQVGGDKDDQCWIRPEEIDYDRPVTKCYTCPALAAALAAASIVFKDDGGQGKYSKTLVHGAETLFRFATGGQGLNYAGGPEQPSSFYNSSDFNLRASTIRLISTFELEIEVCRFPPFSYTVDFLCSFF
ncbi:Endoglucanase 9, partial [Linum perenne]